VPCRFTWATEGLPLQPAEVGDLAANRSIALVVVDHPRVTTQP
jgi:hypothetical protein